MSRISVGLLLPQGLDADLCGSSSEQFAALRSVASHAEELGFGSIWLNDHLMSTSRGGTAPCFECWTTLSSLASVTKHIRLGTMVTCSPYRNPALIAKMAATLDNISDGRLELGLGAGWYELEFMAYGFPYVPFQERARMLNESVCIIKQMLTQDKVTFKGKYYETSGAICEPKPAQTPHPPIWIGGSGRRTLKVAAEYADGCNFGGKLDTFASRLDILKEHCEQLGREYGKIRKSFYGTVIVGRNEEEAMESMKGYVSRMQTPLISKMRMGLNHPKMALSYLRSVLRGTVASEWIVGTPEDCSKVLLKYSDIGVTDFVLYIVDATRQTPLELFADYVLPAIEKRQPTH